MEATLWRLKGAALLLALAVIGWGLAALTRVRPERLDVVAELRDRERPDSVVVFAPRREGAHDLALARTLMARVRVAFDPDRSLLHFADDGASRIVPATARTILVGADSQPRFLNEALPPGLLRRLADVSRTAPPEPAVARWFLDPANRSLLEGAGDLVRKFWE